MFASFEEEAKIHLKSNQPALKLLTKYIQWSHSFQNGILVVLDVDSMFLRQMDPALFTLNVSNGFTTNGFHGFTSDEANGFTTSSK